MRLLINVKRSMKVHRGEKARKPGSTLRLSLSKIPVNTKILFLETNEENITAAKGDDI